MQQVHRALPSKHRARGVTMLEMLTVVAIIGILAAIAYPAYTSYIVKSNRAAAQSYMLDLALAEGQMLVDSRSYTSTVSELNVTMPSKVSQYYTVAITASNTAPQTFTITATPTGSQASDGNLTIDQAGAKSPSGKW
jgi:type IV pilus assembly protein PilE